MLSKKSERYRSEVPSVVNFSVFELKSAVKELKVFLTALTVEVPISLYGTISSMGALV